MTLCVRMDELSEIAIQDDLQSLSGVYLRGFRTDFSDILQTMRGYAAGGMSAAHWQDILDALDYTYGRVEPTANNALPAHAINQVARLLASRQRDYNHFNNLLCFGAQGETLDAQVARIYGMFDLTPQPTEDADFRNRYAQLVRSELGAGALSNLQPPAHLGGGIFNATVTDGRASRLYVKLDLSEWIYIDNHLIHYVVVEPTGTVDNYFPLGRTTVWLSASAQVQHVRSKTAKMFLQGQIAQRLRIEDIEANFAGFVNTILDTDSEAAYSTTNGPC